MSQPDHDPSLPIPLEGTVREQLIRAIRDLWSMPRDSGEDFVVFMDRRRMNARVEQRGDGLFYVLWEELDGSWSEHERAFENPREAAFHAYQGPH